MKQRVWLGLFGLLFGLGFGASAWWGGWSPLLQTTSAWLQTRDWRPVQARVLAAELRSHEGGEGGRTYSVSAKYAYRYAGREYQAGRVGLLTDRADNLDDWQRDWYKTLRAARDQERTIQAWVDPEHPERAILDRGVRVASIMFAIPFAIGFSLVSALGLYFLWLAISRSAESLSEPLLNTARIKSSASGAWGAIVFGGVFLCIGVPAAYFVFIRFPLLHPTLFVYLFPLIGAGLVWGGVKGLGEARLLGNITLQLGDLHPSLGGHLRGAIEFEHQPDAQPRTIRLLCECVDTRGEDTSYIRLWVKEIEGRPIGKRLPFAFELPADLPASEAEAKVYHRWQLQTYLESPVQSVDFNVTVFAAEKDTQDAPLQNAAAELASSVESVRHHDAPIPPQIATVSSGLQRLCIEYNPALYRPLSWVCGIAGLIFGGVGCGLVTSGTSFFGLIFGVIGAVMFYFALRSVWMRCRVTVEAGALKVEEATVFGKKELVFPAKDVVRLIPALSYSTGSGPRQTDFYTLNAVTHDGERVEVGGGISSLRVAESLLHQLRRALGEHVSIADTARIKANRDELAQLDPPSGRRPWRFFGVVMAVGAIVCFGAFSLDFYRDIRGHNDRSSNESTAPKRIAATPDAWFTAMDANRLDDLKAIAALGFDINTQAENGSSALALAASKGHLDIAQWLVDSGADIHQRNGQKNNDNYLTTPLMRAGFGANPALVKLLLDKGADIRAEDHFKRTPLHFMAWGGCGECIRMLVKKGADLEAQASGNRGETPLMSAAGGGHIEGVRTLLELGAYSKAQDSYGYTALGWAQFHQHPQIVELLESAP